MKELDEGKGICHDGVEKRTPNGLQNKVSSRAASNLEDICNHVRKYSKHYAALFAIK
ncbi:MAG: hypothetical protein HUU08_01185 [Candidatus Brocadia sp.]|nr:hypothetical protein [Candidatus Brocadia sp.]